MTNDEAKFMLQGYRPNGSDAGDPAFAEALSQAERDPALRAWFEREQALDSAVAAGLATVSPPAGLRESILAGKRLGARREERPALPWWIGIAASAVLLIGAVAYFGIEGRRQPDTATLASLVDIAWGELNGAHPPSRHADAFPVVAAWLENDGTRLRNGLPLPFERLIEQGCRTQRIAGSLFVEVCFERNGTMFHVYIAPRRDFRGGGLDREPMFQEKGGLATASWADDGFVYVLASAHGAESLRTVL